MKADKIFEETKTLVKREVENFGLDNITPGLATILSADDETAKMYVGLKMEDCKEVGIYAEHHDIFALPENERENAIIKLIKKLNKRDEINGILVQKPLPSYMNEHRVFRHIDENKDVDGLTPHNKGILMSDYDIDKHLLPCTAVGIVKLLCYYKVNVEGMDVGIVGRSPLVGEPSRKLLEDMDATPVCIHRLTKSKLKILREADMIVSAAGRPPEMYQVDSFRLTSDMVKPGAVVVGIGVRKNSKDGKLYFDLPDGKSEEYKKIRDKASFITPNYNGMGLMTRGRLLINTINATKNLAESGLYRQDGYP